MPVPVLCTRIEDLKKNICFLGVLIPIGIGQGYITYKEIIDVK